MGLRLTRRNFVRTTAGAAVTGLGAARALEAQEPERRRPNVLLFFDDQLRAQAVGYNGGTNVETPNIDRLAGQGVTFINALSTCPLCTPFRGMLLTGRYPTHTGLVMNWVESHPREFSIAEAFKAAGYDTAFIGKWHLAAGRLKRAGKHNMTQADQERIRQATAAYAQENPETEYVPPGRHRQGYDYWAAYNFHSNFTRAHYYRDTPQRLIMDGYETDAETDMAIAYMRERANSDRPFFLAIAPHPPHPPWRPDMCPEGYLDRIKPELDWRPNVPEGKFPDQTGPRCYYAMIANVDHNVGRLMQFLDESGLAENTIFVFTSDHGEMLGSHNRMNKMVPYAEAVDIPLIMRWPGRIPARRWYDALYAPMDHMPTLLSLAGADVPDAVDGVDLSAVCLGRLGRPRDAVLMANYVSHWDYFDTGTNWPEWRAVRTRTHTYVKWLAEGREELYHNLDDPCQMTNLADGQRDLPLLSRLRGRLQDLLADAHDEFLPGTAYADWYDDERNLIRTALGPV